MCCTSIVYELTKNANTDGSVTWFDRVVIEGEDHPLVKELKIIVATSTTKDLLNGHVSRRK